MEIQGGQRVVECEIGLVQGVQDDTASEVLWTWVVHDVAGVVGGDEVGQDGHDSEPILDWTPEQQPTPILQIWVKSSRIQQPCVELAGVHVGLCIIACTNIW